MTPREWTIVIMSTAVLGLIGWDVYVAFFNKTSNAVDTISGITLGWSRKVWILPYAVGVLGGHLFWPRGDNPLFGHSWSIPVLLATGLSVFGAGWAITRKGKSWTFQGPVVLLLGILAGHCLWPQ